MDNLRGYGEDDTSSSACLGPSSKELPSTSAGTAPPGTQDAVVAGTPSSVVPVTSGPVPPVSAQPGPSRLGSQDCVTPSSGNNDDLPPPPPPAEPYEDFLDRVGHDQSDSARPTTQPTAVTRLYASVTTTTGTRLPTPFPTFEDSSWMLPNLVPASGIRMPLPASFYAAPPSPWVWPGPRRNRTCCQSVPACSSAGCLSRSSRPFRMLPRTVPRRPCTCSTYCSCSSWLWKVLSYPPGAFEEFFRVPRPLLSSSLGTLFHRPPQVSPLWLPRWHNQMLWTLPRALPRPWSRAGRRTSWEISNLAGHNSLVTLHLSRPWVPLFLLWTWAPTRCGSWVPLTTERRYGLSVRPDQNEQTVASVKAVILVNDLLLTDIGTGSGTEECLLTPPPRPDACLLPPNAHGWAVVPFPVDPAPLKVVSDLCGLAFLGDHAHLCHVTLALHPHHHPITAGPGIVRLPLEACRIRRLAGQPSLSPRRHSPASQRRSRWSSWGRQSSPPLRTRAPNRHSSLSSSRSPSPRGRRSCSMSSRRQRSRSSSRDRISRPHAADQHLLRLRIDDGDQHPHDFPIPEQSTKVDDSQLSAEKVQKLFADLLDPPALSHYADPLPDSTPSNQLVPYDPTAASSSAAMSGINVEPLETHGLFQNYQSFHRLSGDQDKEACTAAYHDLTNLMLSQTPEEVSPMFPLLDPNQKALIRVFSLPQMDSKRSRTKSIFNGLHFITKLSSVP